MTNYGKTRSTIKPEPLVIDEYSVWIHNNIEPITETIGEEIFEGFEYNMIQYDKDEYIQIIAEQSVSMESQLTNAQLALCELYERMVQ